jgi:hypothetical protein
MSASDNNSNNNNNNNYRYETDKIFVTGQQWDAKTKTFRIPFQKAQRFSREVNDLCLSEMSIYNSFFNISDDYNNTLIQFVWQGTTYDIVLESPAFYSVEDINFVLQTFFINNGFYCIDSSTQQRVYFFDIQTNSSLYKVQLSAYQITQNIEGTLLIQGSWNFDNSVPQLIIPEGSQLQQFFGLTSGSYPSNGTTVSSLVTSQSAPDINQVSSLLVSCNLCFSQSGVASDAAASVIFSRAVDVAFGAPITINNNDNQFLSCQTGIFSFLSIQLLDQQFRIIDPVDKQLIFSLLLRRKVRAPIST